MMRKYFRKCRSRMSYIKKIKWRVQKRLLLVLHILKIFNAQMSQCNGLKSIRDLAASKRLAILGNNIFLLKNYLNVISSILCILSLLVYNIVKSSIKLQYKKKHFCLSHCERIMLIVNASENW